MRWENGTWEWDLRWRRELRARDVEASKNLVACLFDPDPCAGVKDRWTWRADKDGEYTTKSAYSVIKASRITFQPVITNKEELAKIWDTPAIQKAKVLAWRILRRRLPTCDNLRKRNVLLGVEEATCNACFHKLESIEHVFLLCPKTGMLWDKIQKWLGCSAARPQSISSHFQTFTHLGGGKESELFLKALWMCTIWVLWKKRNESRFEGKGWQIDGALMEVKRRSWSWANEFSSLGKDFSFCNWCSDDLLSRLICDARLHPRVVNYHKKKCGHNNQLRPKKKK
ncbi:uncharacterized protein LOC130997134 [Salvia miltiorrhiza]|uniref:uncharacterized protein LOC130997134 n=1 Tax=Salvia miltiorrhiza TaxID=226208 RepID=UPI0025ACDE2F|nr:uncharacterized protein LOC130997134 [Salvia miltiorrhiza]